MFMCSAHFFSEGDETEISHFLEDPTSVPIDKKASLMGTFEISLHEWIVGWRQHDFLRLIKISEDSRS